MDLELKWLDALVKEEVHALNVALKSAGVELLGIGKAFRWVPEDTQTRSDFSFQKEINMDFIERIFGVAPDGGDGTTEMLYIAGGLAVERWWPPGGGSADAARCGGASLFPSINVGVLQRLQ